MRRYTPPNHIEDVQEAFNGCRRKNMVPLIDAHPEVASLWDYKKNCGWGPEDFSSASCTIVWWKCPEGDDHEWKLSISSRTGKGTYGCPFCTGRKACKANSLQTLAPEVAARWHKKKNGKLTPSDVTLKSNKKVWWICPDFPSHEWTAQVFEVQRSSSSGCPFCAGQKVCDTNSLTSMFSKIAKQWHPSKNGKLNPAEFTAGSNKKVWWQCEKGHSWKAAIYERTRDRATGCVTCCAVQSRERVLKSWSTGTLSKFRKQSTLRER
jgi:positive regulator of sigma E activity